MQSQAHPIHISIMPGTVAHLNECVEALGHSTLGDVYFPDQEQAAEALQEGFLKQEILVALIQQQCVGFFWWLPHGAFHAFPYLHIIAVKPDVRGQGIGSQLLDHFEQLAFATASKVFLVVADFNPQAQKLYQQRGYTEVGVIPDLYRPGISEHLMLKVRTNS